MASQEHGYEDEIFESAVDENFRCCICMGVLKEPAQCQNNQHYFCTPCITRHLKNSKTCPSCREKLTLKTLSQAPRIVTNCLSKLKVRCENSRRGCREFIQLGHRKTRVANCEFSPVTCSNDGCSVVINKRDRTHHETEVCSFRKVKCCDCQEMRKEVDEVKLCLKEMKDQLESIKTLPDQGEVLEKPFSSREDIIIAGGQGKATCDSLNSVEMFNWSKKAWTPLKPMKECRSLASSVIYKNEIIVIGGERTLGIQTDSMETLNINQQAPRLNFLPRLPYRHKAIVYQDRLILIGGYNGNESKYSDGIYEIQLLPRLSYLQLVCRLPQPRTYHAVEIFNDKILIAGGTTNGDFNKSITSVILYDASRNECKEIEPFPFPVCGMTMVKCGDSLIVVGGNDSGGRAINTVFMYNTTTGETKFLPPMNYKRNGCTAVKTGNVIVVMEGFNTEQGVLNSVELFNFNSYTWIELPPMIEHRAWATAIVNSISSTQ